MIEKPQVVLVTKRYKDESWYQEGRQATGPLSTLIFWLRLYHAPLNRTDPSRHSQYLGFPSDGRYNIIEHYLHFKFYLNRSVAASAQVVQFSLAAKCEFKDFAFVSPDPWFIQTDILRNANEPDKTQLRLTRSIQFVGGGWLVGSAKYRWCRRQVGGKRGHQ